MKRALVTICLFGLWGGRAHAGDPIKMQEMEAREDTSSSEDKDKDKEKPADPAKAPAAAEKPAPDDASPVEVSGGHKPTVELSNGPAKARLFGSLGPAVDFKYTPTATDADRMKGGVAASNAGLGLHAQISTLSGIAYVSVTAPQNDNSFVHLDRATLRWQPIKYLQLSAGHEPIPLDLQAATPMATMMFPQALPWHGQFSPVAKAGGQIAGLHEYGGVWVGIWDGFAPSFVDQIFEERGIMTSARVEVTPLGSFAFDENVKDIPLRIGIGAGVTYREATGYLADGMATRRSRDLRAAGSVRVGFRDLLVELEVMRKQITDDLSMRPDVATGAYAQASWRLRIDTWQLVPLARVGMYTIRQMSAPAQGTSAELGLGTIPWPSDRVRVIGLYQYDGNPDVGTSHRGVLQARLSF